MRVAQSAFKALKRYTDAIFANFPPPHVSVFKPNDLMTWAVAENHPVALRLAIMFGANNIDAVDGSGQTPLQGAIALGQAKLARILVVKGRANVEAVDDEGRTPLHHAVSLGYELARMLITEGHANVAALDNGGGMPLHYAALFGRTELARMLIVEGHSNVNTVNHHGHSPLHHAALIGHNELARMLIVEGHANANAEVVNHDGHSPLHLAALRGHTELARMLIVEGQANINAVNHHGQTPIVVAFENGQHAMVALLQAHGAQLPARLRQQHQQRPALNGNESTQTASVHESASASLTALSEHYRDQDLQAARQALINWVNSREATSPDDLKTPVAKEAIVTLSENLAIRDPRSGISFQQELGLMWLALNDPNAKKSEKIVLSADDITFHRLPVIIDALYEIGRGKNLSEQNVDLGGDSRAICYGGTINKLVEKMAGMHDQVLVKFVTKETISAKAEGLAKEIFGALAQAEKEGYAKTFTNDTLPEALLSTIKDSLTQKLHQEFDEFREQVLRYDEHITSVVAYIESSGTVTESISTALKAIQSKVQQPPQSNASAFLPGFSQIREQPSAPADSERQRSQRRNLPF